MSNLSAVVDKLYAAVAAPAPNANKFMDAGPKENKRSRTNDDESENSMGEGSESSESKKYLVGGKWGVYPNAGLNEEETEDDENYQELNSDIQEASNQLTRARTEFSELNIVINEVPTEEAERIAREQRSTEKIISHLRAAAKSAKKALDAAEKLAREVVSRGTQIQRLAETHDAIWRIDRRDTIGNELEPGAFFLDKRTAEAFVAFVNNIDGSALNEELSVKEVWYPRDKLNPAAFQELGVSSFTQVKRAVDANGMVVREPAYIFTDALSRLFRRFDARQ